MTTRNKQAKKLGLTRIDVNEKPFDKLLCKILHNILQFVVHISCFECVIMKILIKLQVNILLHIQCEDILCGVQF
jgi:hypothetical protein